MRARAFLISAATCIAIVSDAVAQTAQSAPENVPPPPPAMALPASVDDCLTFVEKVFAHALDADLLEDQSEEAEEELEKMESACYDKRFPDALASAKAIVEIVSKNK